MRPEILAALTALLWAVGSYFGKRGRPRPGLPPSSGSWSGFGCRHWSCSRSARPSWRSSSGR